jgi:hypothetical protein
LATIRSPGITPARGAGLASEFFALHHSDRDGGRVLGLDPCDRLIGVGDRVRYRQEELRADRAAGVRSENKILKALARLAPRIVA